MTDRNIVRGQSWMFPASLLKSEIPTFECVMGDEDGNGKYDLGFRVMQDPETRMLRGGSWYVDLGLLSCEYRGSYDLWSGHYGLGFRVVLDD